MVNRCAPMAHGPGDHGQAIDGGPFPQVRGSVRPRPGVPVARAQPQLSRACASDHVPYVQFENFEREGRPGPAPARTQG
jgi:hypothetical protein